MGMEASIGAPTTAHSRQLSTDFTTLVCPALGLPVPRITVGEPANLALLDLEAEWTVREEAFRSRSANSWLLGGTLVGAVVKTVAAGRVVFAA